MSVEELDDFDDGGYDEPSQIAVCPECGGDDLTIVGETDEGNEYVCEDCGERFSAGEEED